MPNATEQDCKCKYHSNVHKQCKFFNKFKDRFVPNYDECKTLGLDPFLWEDLDPINPKNSTGKVCCCSPEIPHDETQKFMIIKRNFEKETLEQKPK
jgi:diadenosine tetraphosphatase ApaH/serine/threonine PP2A family protein phosphatase